ncbi:MAG: LysM peptidoglycan-binding domain-containing protein [Spirochaetia bacterium]
MKNIILIILASILLVFSSCQTPPEEPEQPEIEEEQPIEVEPREQVEEEPEPEEPEELAPTEEPEEEIEAVSANEYIPAESAINRALAADADLHAPVLLDQAQTALQTARELGDIEPAQAREQILLSIEHAELAFETAVAAIAQTYEDRLEQLTQMLEELETDEYAPQQWQEFMHRAENIEENARSGDLAQAQEDAEQLFLEMQEFAQELDEQIRWVRILQRDTEQYIEDAEENDAFLWAPEEMEEAMTLYFEGIDAFRMHNLEQGEDLLSRAKHQALQTVRLSRTRREEQLTNDIMQQVMERIERASQMTIESEEGELLVPESSWEGEQYLDETDEDQENPEEADQSLLLPTDGSPAVLADESELSDLEMAQQLWRRGVRARNAGNLEEARRLFEESLRYVEAHESRAVEEVYTVEYRPGNEDCLWRIAGYESVYGNPFLWPEIWQRNRRKIQNPDLIYPGWRLIIPPLDNEE